MCLRAMHQKGPSIEVAHVALHYNAARAWAAPEGCHAIQGEIDEVEAGDEIGQDKMTWRIKVISDDEVCWFSNVNAFMIQLLTLMPIKISGFGKEPDIFARPNLPPQSKTEIYARGEA